MAQGLLGGVLPAIYSGADQLKRGVYGLLTNPQEQAQRAAQSLLQSRAERQALMGQAFANPDRPFQVTDRNAMAQLGSDVLTGELGIAPVGMIAYHGTPHNILGKFDMSKVGTGEGQQAYGHGMYFAENPNVAASYTSKEGVIPHSVMYEGKSYPYGSDTANLLVDINKFGKEEAKKLYPTQTKFIDEVKPMEIGFQSGNLYKVDIPDEYIPKMIDWDKPLKEQPKDIQEWFEKISPSEAKYKNTGQFLRPYLKDKEYTKELEEMGYKGIKYLDNSSRDAGKGTSNFVVFDPTDVKILERNDKPLEGLLD
jgi:hypothetical protein